MIPIRFNSCVMEKCKKIALAKEKIIQWEIITLVSEMAIFLSIFKILCAVVPRTLVIIRTRSHKNASKYALSQLHE